MQDAIIHIRKQIQEAISELDQQNKTTFKNLSGKLFEEKKQKISDVREEEKRQYRIKQQEEAERRAREEEERSPNKKRMRMDRRTSDEDTYAGKLKILKDV